MRGSLECVSPIDGTVFAERPVLDAVPAHSAVARAGAAQADWAQRPVRYGGEFGGFDERVFHAAGMSDDAFRNTFVEHEVAADLVCAGALDFVNFKGSVARGQAIERAVAGMFTGLGLELGGKDPGHVKEDADPDAAVETLIDGAMFNSGQYRCGIERICVHGSLCAGFVEQATAVVSAMTLGNPFYPGTKMGPVAHVRFAEAVRTTMDEAVANGATPHIDAFAEDNGGAYLSPKILTDVPHDMRIPRDETFGSVVGIMPVGSDEDALTLMNDSPFGLTASPWTQVAECAADPGNGIDTGTVFMNRADYLSPGHCWTSCKNTGRVGALSVIGYHDLTRPKSPHLRKVTA